MIKDKKFLFCFGTRPEILKLKSLIDIFEKNNLNYKVFSTHQHDKLVDLNELSNELYGKFYYIPKKHFGIETIDNRLDEVIHQTLSYFDFNETLNNVDYVIVQGDTISSFVCALAAFHRNIPIIHIEAGMRTYDKESPYPEEFYRSSISKMASIHFCPTKNQSRNLQNEEIYNNIYIVGNTILDILQKNNINEYSNNVIITMHRRENHKNIKEWFSELKNIFNNKYYHTTFYFINHPNPNINDNIKLLGNNVNIFPPMSHSGFIDLLKDCKFLITDSGGLQEESAWFNKKSIVCRKNTERNEGLLSGHSILCTEPKYLMECYESIEHNYMISKECPYGDGKSAEKILKILNAII